MRQSVGRLVRKALSFSKNVHFLHRHIALDDAIYNFVKPHGALRRRVRGSTPQGRKWQPRTPAMAAGLTDHVWSLEEIAALSQPVAPTKRGPYRRTTPGV